MPDRPLPPEEQRLRNLVRLARKPATPVNWLANVPWTDRRWHKELRDALAANPSTPPKTLAKLIQWAPAAFCRNPVASLLVLDDPSFLQAVPKLGLAALLRQASAPAAVVVAIVSGAASPEPRLLEAACLHVTQAAEVSEAECTERVREYWHAALGQPGNATERHQLGELLELDLLPAAFARHLDPDPLLLDDFAVVRREHPAAVDAGRKRPPTRVPERHPAGDQLHRLRGGAFNPEVPGESLATWIGRDYWVDRAIAAHPNTLADTLAILARHAEPAIRRRVLHHPHLPPGLVELCRLRAVKRLLHAEPDPTAGVPWLLGRFAAMQQAPVAVYRPRLVGMAASPAWQDRLAAAFAIGPRPNGQPARPAHMRLLHQLSQDGNELVRAAARARLQGECFTW